MGHKKKKKKRPSRRESLPRLWSILFLLYFFGIPITPPREVVFPATNEQPDSNLITIPPSVHGCHFAAGGCSDVVKETWNQLLVLIMAASVSLSPTLQYEEVDLYFCSA
ncbi:hypothetical protein E2C01_064582 [Portunus trituberculatus]|uniref:Uncharacterized protein n=1 Tax=Portunus trituberculatus TaxID=210409 RepID=A0A5B7HNR3_PORTR|nr:hypothetical protein [Portunus trituberculatus]